MKTLLSARQFQSQWTCVIWWIIIATSVVLIAAGIWQGPDTARVDNLSQDVEQCVYRVAQEALANAAKHAGAQHVTV